MKKLKKHLKNRFSTGLSLFFIRLISSTYKYKFHGMKDILRKLEKKEKLLICHWHQQFFPAIIPYGRYFAAFSPVLMISRSRDGEIISDIANRLGWHTKRGSSSRGGKEAMDEVIEHIKEHGFGGHVLDGPTGPIGVVKPGAIRIAQESSASLIPVRLKVEKYWQVKSWDRFIIPKPFSRVSFFFEKAIKAPDIDADQEEFERVRQKLEKTMKSWLY